MQFDVADMAKLISNGTLQSVVLHEMGHVLGIGTLWDTLVGEWISTSVVGIRVHFPILGSWGPRQDPNGI